MIQSSFAERNLRILFPLPAIIFVALLMIFPVLYTLFLSFTNWNLTSGMPLSFNGINSYLRVLTEPRFLHAVGRTFAFTFFAVVIEGFLGVAIALILNRAFVGKSIAKLLFLLPLVATPVGQFCSQVAWVAAGALGFQRRIGHSVADSRRCLAVDADDYADRPGRFGRSL